jgi:hypothetical protein
MSFCRSSEGKLLKSDQIAEWIRSKWIPRLSGLDVRIQWTTDNCVDDQVLNKIDREKTFAGYFFVGCEAVECPIVNRIERRNDDNVLTDRTGAFVFKFAPERGGDKVEVLTVSAHCTEDGWVKTTLGAVPAAFNTTWTTFSKECDRLAYAYNPEDRVVIIGGRRHSFVPTVEWDEIILPGQLKADLMDDVRSFFTKGVSVYQRLNLKPFRKLLLAGVPGTGKTMLCNGLAKWALTQNYLVIYVSSARKAQGDDYGSNFGKIQYALEVAANSSQPTIILLEELDAYLHEEEKALILNVLDGSESAINPYGTLLISTTNYPEAIDERVLKRPGRLDRIFIVPETKSQLDAGKMLQRYLGAMWREEHQTLVPKLVGYPGAFIREVAICALTQVAYEDAPELSFTVLEQSFESLKSQIEARDDFLKNKQRETGSANGKHEPVNNPTQTT